MEKVHMKMRNVTVATSLLLAISFTSAVNADADSTPAPVPSASPDSYKASLEQFKRDRDVFMTAMRERETKMREINSVFKAAVDKANSDARSAMPTATTPLQKSTISANRRSAIDAAINARDISISALGPMPTPPTEPLRPASNPQGGKSRR